MLQDQKCPLWMVHRQHDIFLDIHRTTGGDDSETGHTVKSGSLLQRLRIVLRSRNNACHRWYHWKFPDHDIAEKHNTNMSQNQNQLKYVLICIKEAKHLCGFTHLQIINYNKSY